MAILPDSVSPRVDVGDTKAGIGRLSPLERAIRQVLENMAAFEAPLMRISSPFRNSLTTGSPTSDSPRGPPVVLHELSILPLRPLAAGRQVVSASRPRRFSDSGTGFAWVSSPVHLVANVADGAASLLHPEPCGTASSASIPALGLFPAELPLSALSVIVCPSYSVHVGSPVFVCWVRLVEEPWGAGPPVEGVGRRGLLVPARQLGYAAGHVPGGAGFLQRHLPAALGARLQEHGRRAVCSWWNMCRGS